MATLRVARRSSHVPAPQVAAAFALLLLAVLPAPLTPVAATFCADYLKAFQCPSLASVDDIDLAAYTGRWYEIGSTAAFRFRFELGLTCTTANYTAKGQVNGRNRVKVVNRGKRSVALARRSQLFVTSLNANRIASNLRIVCRVAVNAAKTNAALAAANATAAQPLAVTAAANKLAAFVTSVSSEANLIDNSLLVFQTQADKMSKRPQMKDFNFAKGQMLKAVQDIQGAAGRILQAAFSGKTAAQGLSGALHAMGGKNAVTAASGLSSLMGNTRVLFAANSIMRLATVVQVTTLAITPSPFRSLSQGFIRGKAYQSKKNAGRLSVTFYGNWPKAPNYSVIDLQGDASDGYSQAIVADCSGGEATIWLLSRTPSMPQSEIDTALETMATAGIKFTGANPFLLTDQSTSWCNNYRKTLR